MTVAGDWSGRRGGCQCGGLRYVVSTAPSAIFICHCRECQKESASAFGVSLIVPRAGFAQTAGQASFWPRIADSGRTVTKAFCSNCGTGVWHEPDPETVVLKAGSLDQPAELGLAVHIWTSRRAPGFVIPEGATAFAEEPE